MPSDASCCPGCGQTHSYMWLVGMQICVTYLAGEFSDVQQTYTHGLWPSNPLLYPEDTFCDRQALKRLPGIPPPGIQALVHSPSSSVTWTSWLTSNEQSVAKGWNATSDIRPQKACNLGLVLSCSLTLMEASFLWTTWGLRAACSQQGSQPSATEWRHPTNSPVSEPAPVSSRLRPPPCWNLDSTLGETRARRPREAVRRFLSPGFREVINVRCFKILYLEGIC